MLVAQSGLTLCDPMDCNPPGSSVHWDFPCKNTGVGCHFLLHGILPAEGSNLSLGKWVLYRLNYQGSLEIIINELKKYEHLHAQSWSHVQLFMTLGTVACQAPLSMVFSRQEYWSVLLFPPPGLQGIEPTPPVSPALAGRFFTISTTRTFMSFLICW